MSNTSPTRRYKHIPFGMLLYIAWRNILNKKLRTSLTIIGIVIGVASIFFLVSFGLGLRDLVEKEILGNESVRSISVETPNSKILKLNTETTERIKGLPHVSELSSIFTFPGVINHDSSEIQGIVYGIDTTYQDLTTLNITKGEALNNSDTNNALINTSALKSMGISNTNDIIGRTVTVTVPLSTEGVADKDFNYEFKVVGVLDSGTGSEVFIPKQKFEALGLDTYSAVKLLADESSNVSQVRSQIESIGFQTSSPMDTIEQVNQVFRFFNIILLGFGLVGMVVAVLGMFNTLTISLLERTKEIGLMIALGSRPKDIRRLFILEATLLSLIGSIVGIILASIIAVIVNLILYRIAAIRGVNEYFTLFAMPWWLTIVTVGFMLIVGLLVVYFPAKRAQKIKPIDALRRE
jgi:putative ABC transport system permease protein